MNGDDRIPGKTHPNCIECGRWKGARFPFMARSGSANPAALFNGECPGNREDLIGEQFIGRTGQFLRQSISNLGFDDLPVAFTNTCRCAHPENKRPTTREINLCRPFLERDIEECNAAMNILLGAVALQGATKLANITERRGQVIQHNGRLYFGTFHPSAVCREPHKYRKDFLQDLAVARRLIAERVGGVQRIDKLKKRYKVLDNEKDIREFYKWLDQYLVLIGDTEFDPLDWLDPSLICLGFSLSPFPKKGWFIPKDHPESPLRGQSWLTECTAELIRKHKWCMHNADADVAVFSRCFDVPVQEIDVVFDSMYASITLHGPEASNALKTLSYTDADTGGYDDEVEEFKRLSLEHAAVLEKVRRMKERMDAYEAAPRKRKKPVFKDPPTTPQVESAVAFLQQHGRLYNGHYSSIPLSMLANPYATGDVDTTGQCTVKYREQLQKENQLFWYRTCLLKAHRLNVVMRQNGLLTDWDNWNTRYRFFLDEKRRCYEAARALPEVGKFAEEFEAVKRGNTFSLKSSPQMQKLLFTVLGLPPSSIKTETGGDSFSYNALLEMRAIKPHPILDVMLEYTSINTYLGYLKGYAEQTWPDGRVHPTFHNFTESGRRGSSEPNIQNVSETADKTRKPLPDDPYNLRMCFRAAPGWTFVNPDYGQLEYRLGACYSCDPVMLEGCQPGKDPHQAVMDRQGFGRPLAKIQNFGVLLYGGSAERFQSELKEKAGLEWSLERCERVVEEGKALHPQLMATIAGVHAFAIRHGYVANRLGHRRLTPHARESDDRGVRQRALREAWNHLVQSLGHDLLEVSMQALQETIWRENLPWKICVDTHDGFLMEVPKEHARQAALLAKHFMQEMPKKLLGDWLQVELTVEVKVGDYFGYMEEVKFEEQEAA